jgi:two-component system, OmpR family, sensor histidine kinase CiaH
MFRELRLRLTFFNASIIALLFFLLTTGSYLFVNAQIKNRSLSFLTQIAEEIRMDQFQNRPPFHPQWKKDPDAHNPPKPPGPPGPPGPPEQSTPPELPRPLMFYVKTDNANQIIFISDTSPLDRSTLQQLTQQTLSSGNPKGELSFNQKTYCYVIVRHNSPGSHIVVFEDFDEPRALLRLLITGLIIIGLFCLVLSVFGSFFMANRAMRPIRTAWQQQKDFVADASHELRTPLAVIQANLDIVRDNPTSTVSSQSQWLDNVQEGVSGMASLVDSLLFLARHDAQQMSMERVAFDLSETVKNELKVLTPILRARSLQWTESIDAEIELVGDAARMRQVLRILMDNAIRHTPSGGSLQISLRCDSQLAVLTVENTGDVIAPEHIERIFERFYQADRSRAKGGAGLGLAIARCIVSEHGGIIEAKPGNATGATFIVKLPCK